MKLYHGTIRNRVPSILRSGLESGIGGRRGKGVYLSETIEGAKSWAETQRTSGGEIAIFVVNIPRSLEYRLTKDYALNQLFKYVWVGDWLYRDKGEGIPKGWVRLV